MTNDDLVPARGRRGMLATAAVWLLALAAGAAFWTAVAAALVAALRDAGTAATVAEGAAVTCLAALAGMVAVAAGSHGDAQPSPMAALASARVGAATAAA